MTWFSARLQIIGSYLHRPSVLLLVALVFLVGAGCDRDTASGEASTVEGLLMDVRSGASGELEQMELEASDGSNLIFEVDLAPDAFVSVEHLRQHIATGQAVRVSFEERANGRLIAYRIDDAGDGTRAEAPAVTVQWIRDHTEELAYTSLKISLPAGQPLFKKVTAETPGRVRPGAEIADGDVVGQLTGSIGTDLGSLPSC